jgi:hypothetical protein
MADSPEFTAAELALFEACLACCTHYFEWGCGTSTAIAARRVSGSVTSVDSSADWIARVRRGIEAPRVPVRFVHFDIGAVGAFGYPIDKGARARWLNYSHPLRHVTKQPDLVLVDGRFRVACALRSLWAWKLPVLVHDYANRPHYAAIGECANEIARAERLSLFIGRGQEMPEWYLYDPR